MTESERFRTIRDLFDRAAALPPAQRADLLSDACGADEALRAEVERLLASHDAGDDFLESPAFIVDGDDDQEESPDVLLGRRIGSYELKRVIARGGMGVVYEALQEQPRRSVAVKIIRSGIASRSAMRRFQYEAEILGRLRHPNIAQVYEAGAHYEESAREGGEPTPYFAMEFIPEAKWITEYCRDAGLSIEQRLRLFAKVCDAVHHGHLKGIVHRDLKPGNILVDSAGEPKVIDFGVARATDSDLAVTTQQTQVGQLLGTVQYMSPEQCDGAAPDLDGRSDVYSLGAVLYELLADRPAFDLSSATLYQATQIIREQTPTALSAIDRRFRGDLETIIGKAMEKDRDRRYQSAEALKRDLERHRAGEPIEARPASRWVKVSRWMGSHPALAGGALAAVVALCVLTITMGMIWYGNSQPFYFLVSPDGSYAHLMSMLNRPLATIGGQDADPDTVQAVLVEGPRELGGGKLALYTCRGGQYSTGRQLFVTPPESLAHPLWVTSPTEPSPPAIPWPVEEGKFLKHFYVPEFHIEEVFAESPGPEVMMILENTGSSQNAIRICSLDGEVLFEAWHLGLLRSAIWWREAGIIVATGDRHGIPDVRQFGFGAPPWPNILFAIRPKIGVKTGWINEVHWPQEWQSGDGSEQQLLAWYRCIVYPTYDIPSAATGLRLRHQPDDPFGTLLVDIDFYQHGGMSIFINHQGQVVGSQSSDVLRQSIERGEYPAQEPRLVDWPPSEPVNP